MHMAMTCTGRATETTVTVTKVATIVISWSDTSHSNEHAIARVYGVRSNATDPMSRSNTRSQTPLYRRTDLNALTDQLYGRRLLIRARRGEWNASMATTMLKMPASPKSRSITTFATVNSSRLSSDDSSPSGCSSASRRLRARRRSNDM